MILFKSMMQRYSVSDVILMLCHIVFLLLQKDSNPEVLNKTFRKFKLISGEMV